MRSSGTGPRSLTRTKIDRRFFKFVTRTQLPSGRLRCAQVRPFMSNVSPIAVLRPWNLRPYHDALPISNQRRGLIDCVVDLADGAGSLADAETPSADIIISVTAPAFIIETLRLRILAGISFIDC